MKSAVYLFAFLLSAATYAGPISLLTDSRYRYSDGFAEYQSTSSYLNGQKSIGWNMTANTAFGGMDGYDLNEIPLGAYNRGSGAYIDGVVGMTSKFVDGSIGGSGWTSNYLGIATQGPYAQNGDDAYVRLDMRSHYEITFSVNESVLFDLSGALLGGSSLSLFSNNGFNFLGSDNFSSSGMLTAGIYTLVADANSSLKLDTDGEAKEDKGYKFNFNYRAVPDAGASALLVGFGFAGVLVLARRRR